MSKFTSDLINGIKPYVPGEQPRDKKYIKLNTNENPYYASRYAVEAISDTVLLGLNRYSDPESTKLIAAIAEFYGVGRDNVLVTNGSDEALAFCFFAYAQNGVCYPDVTYGFYDVIANLYKCEVEHVPLEDDFTIDADKFVNKGKTVVIADPNAQTGIALSGSNLVKIIENNADNIVIIDRAYADFGETDVIPLVKKYDNLIVVSTFSKSRSLAGARVGYVIANENLIADLKKVKNSFHPYNVNSLSAILAERAINDGRYFFESVKKIRSTRERLTAELKGLNFTVLPSSANFVLASSDEIGGETLYLKLKERGVLVRYFSDDRIKNFVRITVGSDEEIDALVASVKDILRGQK